MRVLLKQGTAFYMGLAFKYPFTEIGKDLVKGFKRSIGKQPIIMSKLKFEI